jgi:putative transposase
VELETYRRLQKETKHDAVMRRLVRGVSCRDYRAVVEAIRRSRGMSASAVSRSFVEASAERVRQLAERRFEGVRFVAMFIDGVSYAHETVIAAIGVTEAGEKQVLALRHGATENARTCVDLLNELRERGISTEQRLLFVIDGSKALRSAIAEVWGENAIVQRCRVHKLRNVEAYVPKKHWQEAKARIQKAYAEPSFAAAKKSLETTARWLALINTHAAASLREGLTETLTVNRLRLSGRLRRSFATTNMVESVFSRVRMMTSRVKRWRAASMRERWCATALLHAEQGFHRIYGHLDIATQLLPKLDTDASVITKSA